MNTSSPASSETHCTTSTVIETWDESAFEVERRQRSSAFTSRLAPERLIGRTLVGGVTLAGLAALVVVLSWAGKDSPNAEQQRIFIDALTLIVGGFVVTGLGSLIPSLLSTAKDSRETARESRVAYSEAKTAVIYLPGSLSEVGYAEAMQVLEDAHRKLHIAETYAELESYLDWYPGGRDVWVAENYWQLTAARRLLQSSADAWADKGRRATTDEVEQLLCRLRKKFFDRDGLGWRCTLAKAGYSRKTGKPIRIRLPGNVRRSCWERAERKNAKIMRRGHEIVPRRCWTTAEREIEKWLSASIDKDAP
jgi:hypothetical protein